MNLQTSTEKFILIVDDDPLMREILEDSLAAHNYKTLLASDGIEAIALYAQHRFDIGVVLIDLMMASLDGATTIRILRAMNSQVSVIAMSGLPFYEIGHFLNGMKVETLLLKPFSIQELLHVLHAIERPKVR